MLTCLFQRKGSASLTNAAGDKDNVTTGDVFDAVVAEKDSLAARVLREHGIS